MATEAHRQEVSRILLNEDQYHVLFNRELALLESQFDGEEDADGLSDALSGLDGSWKSHLGKMIHTESNILHARDTGLKAGWTGAPAWKREPSQWREFPGSGGWLYRPR